MPSRVTIFDHHGVGIAELNTATTRSWILDGYGRCQFQIATFTDPNYKRSILQYGNMVYITHIPTRDEFGNIRGKLPDWVGVIVPPMQWDFGLVTVTAYSAEYLLTGRPMPYVTEYGTAGMIFSDVIGFANSFGGFPVQPGAIAGDTAIAEYPLRLSAYEESQNLSAYYSQDFDVLPSVNKGLLTLYGNWYNQRGVSTGMGFSEGTGGNMRLPKLTEQGTISNIIVGHNNASSASGVFTSIQVDDASVSDYGIFGLNQNYNVQSEDGVTSAAQSALLVRSRPTITLELTALDVGNTFGMLDLGNLWRVVLKSIGFYAGSLGFVSSVRITGMEYDDLSNECKITTKALTGSLTEDNYA